MRGVEIWPTIWSAGALVTDPDEVRAVHADYITAGADVITTNTYGVIRQKLAREGMEDQCRELNELAVRLAREAADAAGRQLWIAGSLPPLNGSYRADRVQPFEVIEPLYREQAAILVEAGVDLLICETMSSSAEARAAATGGSSTGVPVWVSFTLHEDRSGRLRSGETIAEAMAALADLPVGGVLANCCAPESIRVAMPALVATGQPYVAGYANTFEPVPDDWTLDGSEPTDGVLGLRTDLPPDAYLSHVDSWWEAGAMVVGGCCGTRPAHIQAIKERMAIPA